MLAASHLGALGRLLTLDWTTHAHLKGRAGAVLAPRPNAPIGARSFAVGRKICRVGKRFTLLNTDSWDMRFYTSPEAAHEKRTKTRCA